MPLRALRLFPLLNAVELNPATSSFSFTPQFTRSREWSRRVTAHYQNGIPARYVHRTTRGKKSKVSRYTFYTLQFYLTSQIFTAIIVA